MLAELLFIVDLLQRKGLHQTSGDKRFTFFGRSRPQAPQPVVTVASPVQYDLTMPVDISSYSGKDAAFDYIHSGTGRPESMKKKIATGRL